MKIKSITYLILFFIMVLSCNNSQTKQVKNNEDFKAFTDKFTEYSLPKDFSPSELGKYIVLGDSKSDLDSLEIVKYIVSKESVKKYNSYDEIYKKGIRFKLSDKYIMLIIPNVKYKSTDTNGEKIMFVFEIFSNDGELISKRNIGKVSDLNQTYFSLSSDSIKTKEIDFVLQGDSVTKAKVNNYFYLIKDGIIDTKAHLLKSEEKKVIWNEEKSNYEFIDK